MLVSSFLWRGRIWTTLHHEKISKQNQHECKAINAQAYVGITTLDTKERAKQKNVCPMTAQVIEFVKGEFETHRYRDNF
jgi:hypothetical protein